VIPETTLRDVQGHLMDAMTALYVDAKDDEQAHSIAHALVHIYDDIEFDLVTRSVDVTDAGM
jgi:uncharacterized damage-inducible protein DinB